MRSALSKCKFNEKKSEYLRLNVPEKRGRKHVWDTRPIEPTQKLIDRMPKVMKAIIEAKGGKNIEFRM